MVKNDLIQHKEKINNESFKIYYNRLEKKKLDLVITVS